MGASTSAHRERVPDSLSAADYVFFNRFATRMDLFHSKFRDTWNTLYDACAQGRRPEAMSARSFINLGIRFCQSLESHHRFEEAAIFPVLAEKMPIFREQQQLLAQHEEIHVGLKSLERYLMACEIGEKDLRMSEMKEIMDSFGAVLWEHLDQEVEQLGAKNMQKYYTREEFQDLPL